MSTIASSVAPPVLRIYIQSDMLYYIVFKRYIYINYMIIRHNIQIQSDFNTMRSIILCSNVIYINYIIIRHNICDNFSFI